MMSTSRLNAFPTRGLTVSSQPIRTTCAEARQSGPEKARLKEGRFALKTEVVRAVLAVKAAGVPINCIELRPDGAIRLSNNPENENDSSGTEFDRWNNAGKL